VDLIPAIDLLDGTAVRLVQGDYASRAATLADPASIVRGWVDAGVRWLHIVDLGGARAGHPVELEAAGRLAEAARARHAEVRIELGGGLRTPDDIAAAMAVADVAILGTAAIENPSVLAEAVGRWPGRIVVSVDVRDGRVALDGWTREAGVEPVTLVQSLEAAGVSGYVVTDITRDGTRRGPNMSLLAEMRRAVPRGRLVAAGGIGTADELRALDAAGIDGAVVGLALVDGSLPIERALAAAGQSPAEVA
jgi:phosphoribosylformimino-5-aminoimidazole carboxamide ribotide isomerase